MLLEEKVLGEESNVDLSTTNPTWNGLRSNSTFRSDSPI